MRKLIQMGEMRSFQWLVVVFVPLILGSTGCFGEISGETDEVGDGENLAPTAWFEVPSASMDGLQVAGDASGSTDPDGTIVDYLWDWSGAGSGQESGVAPVWTYLADGVYEVTLTVTDNEGATDSEMRLVSVSGTGGVIGPVFSTDVNGMSVDFDASGSTSVGSNPRTYQWEFGDGASIVNPDAIPSCPLRSENLLPNTDFTGGWYHPPSSTVSNGVVTFATLPGLESVVSPAIPVEAGQIYTASFDLKSDDFPGGQVQFYLEVNNTTRGIQQIASTRQAVSKAGVFEECSIVWRAVPGDTTAKLVMAVFENQPSDLVSPGNGPIHLANPYFGKGVGFEKPPTSKPPFKSMGDPVHIASDGTWFLHGEPFFPKSMFTNVNTRSDFNFYSSKGWNCQQWAIAPIMVTKAHAAGMKSFLNVSQYMDPDFWAYNNTAAIDDLWDGLTGPEQDSVIGWYWDNENNFDEWAVPQAMVAHIRSRAPHLPIVALQGFHGVARQYNSLVDASGVYISPEGTETGNAGGSIKGLNVLECIEQNTTLPIYGQMNTPGSSESLRGRFNDALLGGARMLGMYADGPFAATPALENHPWWADSLALTAEMDVLWNQVRVQVTSPTVTHVYPGAGTYTVTLTVTDERGGIAHISQDVTLQ